jgi:hypothetical protein
MTPQWQPFREPLRTTMLRTVMIAIIAGVLFARLSGRPGRWPLTVLLMLWPSFGGHWVDLWFLNWLRPRLPISDFLPIARGWQIAARLGVWFAGGVGLALGVRLTAMALPGFPPGHWPAWWLGGPAFIGIELLAHLALQLRGRPSFYNGRG